MKGTLDPEEIAIVMKTMEQSSFLSQYEMKVDSSLNGKPGKQTIWDKPGNGTLGALTRSERIAGVADVLLGGGGVHHYFNKMLRKEAGDLGEWQWHQDYGSYWYYDHFLRPDMLTVWVAIDPSKKHNGCLKVIPGSNNIGRIDCKAEGNQRVVDPKRVQQAIAQSEVMYVEVEAGDAVFFHGNTLHSSEGNPSADRRMAFAAHFTKADNLIFHENPGLGLSTTAMEPQPHSRIKELGVVLDDPASLGLQDPTAGAVLTSKRDAVEAGA